jgi:flavin reductase (DIM6/NTAB) family NADH-FMN oxidoreductase RutF
MQTAAAGELVMDNSDPEGITPLQPVVDTREFRAALGCFATGVTIITARGPRDELIGITANSFNSVSMNPPLVLFSLGRSAYSLKAFLSTHNFAVNVLGAEQQELSNRFAKALVDKWTGVDYMLTDTGCPFLAGTLARFECRTHHTYDGGDHVIFVGEVMRCEYRPEGKPLLYYRGGYAQVQEAK